MLILLLGVTLVCLVAFLVLRIKYPSTSGYFDTHDFFTLMSVFLGFVALSLIIAICCLATTVATESVLDSKIEMYKVCKDNNIPVLGIRIISNSELNEECYEKGLAKVLQTKIKEIYFA